jgi:hypothetical protein
MSTTKDYPDDEAFMFARSCKIVKTFQLKKDIAAPTTILNEFALIQYFSLKVNVKWEMAIENNKLQLNMDYTPSTDFSFDNMEKYETSILKCHFYLLNLEKSF